MKKYIVLSLTNGTGYSEPGIYIFNDERDAINCYKEECENMFHDFTVVLEKRDEKTHIFKDCPEKSSEDNYYGIHLIELEYYQWYCLHIVTNYVSEFKFTKVLNPNIREVVGGYDWLDEDKDEIQEVVNNYGTTVQANIDDAYIHLQII